MDTRFKSSDRAKAISGFSLSKDNSVRLPTISVEEDGPLDTKLLKQQSEISIAAEGQVIKDVQSDHNTSMQIDDDSFYEKQVKLSQMKKDANSHFK